MELVNQWLKQDPKAIKKVNELLASAGLTMEDVEARAFINEIKNMKDAEQLSANLHARLHAELRELDYRRKARPRHDPVDVEFRPIDFAHANDGGDVAPAPEQNQPVDA